MRHVVAQRYVGRSVKRSEDPRLLTGRGFFVGDVTLPGMVHATFVRSPLPHARIVGVDTDRARGAPGVVAVYTGAEIEEHISPGPVGMESLAGSPRVAHSVLATDKVRFVGDPVALVVARDRYLAEDAAELIDVVYDELPAVANAEQALAPDAPVIFDALGGNVIASSSHAFSTDHPGFASTRPGAAVVASTSDAFADIDELFARADHVVEARLVQHRHQHAPLECRGSVSSYDPETGRLTVWSASQGVHHVRLAIATKLGLAVERVRVLTADVGGSFGLKLGASREDVACAVASVQLGRPVAWIEDRIEHLAAAGQAREETFNVSAAVTNEGDILGLKLAISVDTGSYPAIGHIIGSLIMSRVLGPYRIGALACDITAVVTNKASYLPYRGPWAGETWVRERMIDVIARHLGREPMEIRLRNVVTRGVEPTTMVTGYSLASVTSRESLERVCEFVDIPAFRRRQAAARAQGQYLGFGCATFLEAPGPNPGERFPAEQMRIELAEDGTVVVYSSQMPHGQGIETTTAQIVADELGMRIEGVRVVVGDSDVVPPGFTGGSRSATMTGGASRHTARALRTKILDLVSHVLEASPADLDIIDGTVGVHGVPARGLTLGEVAAAAREPGRFPEDVDNDLSVSGAYDGGAGGWSGGTHCAIVELDIETGRVRIERYLVVEDCGQIINPAIVAGQISGGVAQGIGAVLLERSFYDDDAQLRSSTFMDYLLPTATDIPRIELEHLETVPLDRDVNFRGIGEGGMVVAPVTIVNAIEDALAPLGVRILEQCLPPARIVELIGQAPQRPEGAR